MKRLTGVIDNINEKIGKACTVGLVMMIVIIFIEVIGRYVFNHPFLWTNELAQYWFAATAMLVGAWLISTDSHVRVDILYQRFSVKKRAIADVVTFIFFLAFAGGLLWASIPATIHSISVSETSASGWNPPLYPIRALVPLGVFLLLTAGIVKFARNISIIRGKGKVEAENEAGEEV